MKKPMKLALALTCAAALAAGSALASSAITTRTLQAQFMGIQLVVDGRTVSPVDANGAPAEPFAVDGTVYLPARALGEALGKDVAWDGETGTVYVGNMSAYIADAQQLVSNIESAHPAFLLDQLPEGYEAAKADFLAVAADPRTDLSAFSWAAQAYTASLKDGHTSVSLFGNGAHPVLSLGLAAVGESLYCTDEAGKLTDREVTAIGGLPVADLFAFIDKYFPGENASGQAVNRAAWAADRNVLLFAGAVLSADGSGAVVTVDGKEENVAFVLPEGGTELTAIVTGERMGDVYYVDLNQCILGEELDKVTADLGKALKAGVRKVIIDVRGNGGGISDACYQLLRAMDMEIPSYGEYVRYSTLALDEVQDPYKPYPYERGYTRTEGGELTEKPDLSSAKANPKLELVVLTDEGTFSSATMLGVWVQDGGLGTVIGRASANSPNSYGDILYYQLGNTGLFGSVSHKQWQRPDQSADYDTLAPDVETAVGEDALQTALDFLSGR